MAETSGQSAAGSEANHGILRGYLVDVGKKGIDLAQRVEG